MDTSTPPVPGAGKLIEWFGHWPSFHDAEILSVHINRGGTSAIRIRTWNRTDRVDEGGQYIREREATVVFEFSGIKELHLEGEDADVQNVIAALSLEKVHQGYRLRLAPCYGLAGELMAEAMTVRIEHD